MKRPYVCLALLDVWLNNSLVKVCKTKPKVNFHKNKGGTGHSVPKKHFFCFVLEVGAIEISELKIQNSVPNVSML